MRTRVAVVMGLALFFLVGAFAMLGGMQSGSSGVAQAASLAQGTSAPTPTPAVRYVSANSGQDNGDCTNSSSPCQSIQYAVEQAVDGDLVWVAAWEGSQKNLYTGSGDAVVELTKSLSINGGFIYTPQVGWASPPLVAATVDGEGVRRPLYVKGVTVTLNSLYFVNGNAERGGNVYAEDATLRFIGTPILSGTATYGGGLYLKNCHTSFKAGNLGGGGLALLSGLLLIQNNTAEYGGGLYVEGGSPVLSGLAVYSNAATIAGGGAYFYGGSPTFVGGVVLQNSAESGGGFYLHDSTARIAAVGVYSNTASEGAGFYLSGPAAFSTGAMPVILNNYVRYNRATNGAGGGFYFDQASVGMVNDIVADNQATDGAAMYVRGASPQVYHCTLAQNSGDTGVYVTNTPSSVWPPVAPLPSNPLFFNSMVVSHTTGVYVASTGLPSPLENRVKLQWTLWWGNDEDISGAGTVITVTDIHGDPEFRCTGSLPDCVLPYHILTDSVAVDAGGRVSSAALGVDLLVDIDGQLRPSGKGYDIGADEVVSNGHSVWLVPSMVLIVTSPGKTVTQTHWLLNSSTVTDTYDLSAHSEKGWPVSLDPVTVTLSAGTSTTVRMQITVPDTATTGMQDTVNITVTSQSDPDVYDRAIDRVMVVSSTLDLSVSKEAAVEGVAPGEAVTYTIVVTKAGVVSGTVAVTLTDTAVPTSALGSWLLPSSCTGDLALGTITCTWQLAGSAPLINSWTVVITSSAAYTGLLINTAFVDASEVDRNAVDNAAMVAVGVQNEKYRICLPLVLRGYAP